MCGCWLRRWPRVGLIRSKCAYRYTLATGGSGTNRAETFTWYNAHTDRFGSQVKLSLSRGTMPIARGRVK